MEFLSLKNIELNLTVTLMFHVLVKKSVVDENIFSIGALRES